MALPYYLRVSFLYSAVGWAPPLAIALVDAMWIGLTQHRLAINRINVEFALTFGGFFFVLLLLTVVGCCTTILIHRQWNGGTPFTLIL